MKSTRIFNVLFLCKGNSARSIMAECALNRFGKGKFQGFSAGSYPRGEIHPLALELLKQFHFDTSTLRSKSWNEFSRPGSPPLDFVFTVCDQVRGEVCPAWPGQPLTAHWGAADPAAFEGTLEEQRRFFNKIYLELDTRIRLFISLPFEALDRFSLQRRLEEIGKAQPDNDPNR